MTYKDRSRAVYSSLLFLMMISFTVSSYAAPCHNMAENKIGVVLKQNTIPVNNTDFYISNQPGISQDNNGCQNHTGKYGKSCCRCKIDNQPSALIEIVNRKFPDYHNYKNVNDTFYLLPSSDFVIYRSNYNSYSSSLFSPLQSTRKHRILLI